MYPIIKVPFETIPFEIMSKTEADHYFNWFVSLQSSRIQLLAEFYEHTKGGSKQDLDFTLESLVKLWEWFIPRIKLIEKTHEEMEEEVENTLGWLREEIQQDVFKFSSETEALIIDIGFYLSEIFMRSFSQLEWGLVYKPRNFIDVNKPVIVGFKNHITLNPITVVNNCALRAVRENSDFNKGKLVEVVRAWVESL